RDAISSKDVPRSMYRGSLSRISAKVSGYSEARAARATPPKMNPPVRLPFSKKIAAVMPEPASTAFFQFSIFPLGLAGSFDLYARSCYYGLLINVWIYLRVFKPQVWRTWMRNVNSTICLSALLFWSFAFAADHR